MPCYKPLSAYKPDGGGPLVFSDKGGSPIEIACGQCMGCRVDRAQDWALRLEHEAKMHEHSCFLTLTYEDNPVTLIYSHIQLFLRSMRRAGYKLRFYCVGEYGEKNWRPHWHLILYGYDFHADRKCRVREPHKLYDSVELSKYWARGFATIGEVTPETIAYVSRYALKKITGQKAEEHYTRVDPTTGEIHYLTPEFSRMSLKPGLGSTFYEQYKKDMHVDDAVTRRGGIKLRIPKYYMRKYGDADPVAHDLALFERSKKSNPLDNTPERLAVREKVHKAKIAHYTQRKL